jgi:hypothetical protein
MTNKTAFDLQAAHFFFSTECFNHAWTIMEKPERSHEENEEMLALAMASLWHWRQRSDCTLKNLSVSYWQVSRVFSLIGQGENARHYGELSLAASKGEGIGLYYRGYAYEALARAETVSGRIEEAKVYKHEASLIAGEISDENDRKQLLDDLDTIKISRR